jgi:WD40 repeat protein
MLAVGGFLRAITLWDTVTGQPLGSPLTSHTSEVYSVAFSPDGRMLASGSKDKTIVLWDVATRQPIGVPLAGHTDSVTTMAFSPDGKKLVSGSHDKKIILWDVDIGSWVARACHIANRNLTQAEWHQFIGQDIPYKCTCPDLPPGKGAPLDVCVAVD